MSLTTDIPMSRIDARIPLSVRETIDRFFDCGGAGKGGTGHCGAIACTPCARRSAPPCRRSAVRQNGKPIVLP